MNRFKDGSHRCSLVAVAYRIATVCYWLKSHETEPIPEPIRLANSP
jgi:hypothetical protein